MSYNINKDCSKENITFEEFKFLLHKQNFYTNDEILIKRFKINGFIAK